MRQPLLVAVNLSPTDSEREGCESLRSAKSALVQPELRVFKMVTSKGGVEAMSSWSDEAPPT